MDNLQTFVQQVRRRLLTVLLLNNLLLLADWWLAGQVLKLGGWWLVAAVLIAPVLSVSFVPWLSARALTRPTKLIWQAILHITPNAASVPAPDIKTVRLGRELVTNLVNHIYQLASVADGVEQTANARPANLSADFIANNLPLPLVVLGKDNTVLFANDSCCKYLGQTAADIAGKDVYSVIDMSFPSDDTFDAWLQKARTTTVTAAKTWERVRLNRPDGKNALQFDLAAYYNRDNPNGIEALLVLFDHTETYAQDDQAMSFVALAVHELRTPLTLLRGYIDVFDEELDGKLDAELKDFMFKMNAAAQQLTSFVSNILNVARIEGDQLFLRLGQGDWAGIVNTAVRDWQLRAQVRGIKLQTAIAPGLPPVGVDRLSIYEVLSNLIDNAIKYSGNGKVVVISAQLTEDGLVETTVQDHGIGIPESVVPKLFDKFYRNYRTRTRVGGTGLGLYLSKTIITAHGGNIWVRSKPGEGTTLGFTVLPYARLKAEQKAGGPSADITTSAHGWIKNHSLYRR